MGLGKEVAPETGTPHLQGYIYFKEPVSVSTVRRILSGAHIELARGDFESNRVYCTKSGTYTEEGCPPVSAKDRGASEKNRWSDIIDLARTADYESVRRLYPDVYFHSLGTLENIRRKRPMDHATLDGGMQHQWFVGPTGSGKSVTAREENPGAFVKDPMTAWWDGYDHEKCVIIDDFDKYQKSQGGDMKRWLDRYCFQAQVKGGYMLARPEKIIVTSQYHPSQIWDDEKTVEAILRRVTIREFGVPRALTPPRRMELFDLVDKYA